MSAKEVKGRTSQKQQMLNLLSNKIKRYGKTGRNNVICVCIHIQMKLKSIRNL